MSFRNHGDKSERTCHASRHLLAVALSGCVVWSQSVATGTAQAQTNNSYPMLMSVRPAAAQVGQTTEHEVTARYILSGADQIIVSGEGVTAIVVPEEKSDKDKDAKEEPRQGRKRNRGGRNASKIKLKFTVAPDAVPGVRDFRIITPHGAARSARLSWPAIRSRAKRVTTTRCPRRSKSNCRPRFAGQSKRPRTSISSNSRSRRGRASRFTSVRNACSIGCTTCRRASIR